MSLLDVLPQPSFSHQMIPKQKSAISPKTSKIALRRSPPPYGQRRHFTPHTQSDFGQGGAFPEIAVVQYPLGMGLKDGLTNPFGVSNSNAVTPLSVAANGEIQYDAVLTQNSRPTKTVFSGALSASEKAVSQMRLDKAKELAKPDAEEAAKLTEETRRALEAVVEGKIEANRPRQVVEGRMESNAAVYVKLTPSTAASGQKKPGSKSRVVRLQTAVPDPLEPPKHRFRKQPPRAPSPPAPVLQSPPRQLSHEERAAWKIPPCVSNWKNVKSYTVPLDKRVAADGRGYESFTINSRFSALSTSLYEAENLARENVRLRGEQLRKIAQQKRQRKEAELERRAREVVEANESTNTTRKNPTHIIDRKTEQYNSPQHPRRHARNSAERDSASPGSPLKAPQKPRYAKYAKTAENSRSATQQMDARREREKLRRDRLRERRRELRQEERRQKRGYSDRARERDIVERMALGETVAPKGAEMYDSRLFNTESGVGSGFAADDVDNCYDKPLFDSVSKTVYVPRVKEAEDGEGSRQARRSARQGRPVEFVEG